MTILKYQSRAFLPTNTPAITPQTANTAKIIPITIPATFPVDHFAVLFVSGTLTGASSEFRYKYKERDRNS